MSWRTDKYAVFVRIFNYWINCLFFSFEFMVRYVRVKIYLHQIQVIWRGKVPLFKTQIKWNLRSGKHILMYYNIPIQTYSSIYVFDKSFINWLVIFVDPIAVWITYYLFCTNISIYLYIHLSEFPSA